MDDDFDRVRIEINRAHDALERAVKDLLILMRMACVAVGLVMITAVALAFS